MGTFRCTRETLLHHDARPPHRPTGGPRLRSPTPATTIRFWFKQFKEAPTTSPLYQRGIATVPPGTLAQSFAEDVRNDNLPQVSWIIGTNASTEHPPYLPAAGATVIYELLEALACNPKVFSKTVFFLNYDENDGYFDHVPPPTPPPGLPVST